MGSSAEPQIVARPKQMRSFDGRGIMKKRRSTEEQVDGVINDAKLGVKIEELCKQLGISTVQLANWLEHHEALEASERRRLKQIEEENRRLRSVVADLTLSNQALKLAVSKSGEN
jgi:putative transposase